MFALVDCNSCYASCEQIFRPELRGKPVVVLTNNDGCIVARTREAKALGVPDLLPYFKIEKFLKQNNVHVFSSNYELYGDISKRVMSLLADFASDMEVYSIDEAFLDLSGHQNLYEHGMAIKKACWKEQRMPVSVGIGQTKTLSKLANHIAKQSNKLDGVCVIENPDQWHKVFNKISTRKIWGVGSRISKRLQDYEIFTVEQLRSQNPKRLRKDFGVNLERTIRELNGEACINMETVRASKQSITCSRSFSKKVQDKQELKQALATYSVRACEKLRKQNSLTGQLTVFVQTSRFNPPYYFGVDSINLLYPSNDTRVVLKAVLTILEKIYKPGFAYAKAGIILNALCSEDFLQHDFFTPAQSESAYQTMSVLDAVNKRYGDGSLFVARQGVQRTWSMARKYKSPAYTTRLNEIPRVKIS